MAAIEITCKDLTARELQAASAKACDAKAARRMLAIALVLEGKDRKTAAETCGMDRQTLRDWVHRYNAQGLAGLKNRRATGRPCRQAIDLARAGDFLALKLCVERGLPAIRDEPVHFKLAAVDSTADINAAIGDVITAMAGGEITPFEATSVAALLELKRRAIETIDMESRLRALEMRRALPNGHGHDS